MNKNKNVNLIQFPNNKQKTINKKFNKKRKQ